MKKTIQFAMGFHNHQPVGNFDYVLEDAYKKSYYIFLECLERHPKIKAVVHYTGPLWDYFLDKKPEWVQMLKKLVQRGQIEMISGGYYEPILVNIPDRDKIDQIKKMNATVKNNTGFDPEGMWCAERVWEPSLAKPINMAGIKYTILDETHFNFAGFEEKDLFGYFVTEEQGYPLNVVPINFNLRNMIPGTKPEDVIGYLESRADESGTRLAVFADDGEKFGVWPNSFKQTWEDRWMDRFFDLLENKSDTIKIVTISEYMKNNKPLGRVYLPTASYFEMTTWALPTQEGEKLNQVIEETKKEGKWDRYRPFLKGGFWRNFLVKYPESNRIQKKALHVSEKVDKMTGSRKEEAKNELFKGECNCPYWHGVFGGIYLPHLRHAVQESLIKAEAIADEEAHKGLDFIEIEQLDINRDLDDEVTINTKSLHASFIPHRGGALYELDYKPLAINMLDTLTRRKETYHEKLLNKDSAAEFTGGSTNQKEADLDKHLKFDKYERFSFIDHFFTADINCDKLWCCEYEELGDFIEAPYDISPAQADSSAALTFTRSGSVKTGKDAAEVEILKKFGFNAKESGFNIEYFIKNNSKKSINTTFGCELNLSFLSKDEHQNYIVSHAESNDGKLPLTSKGVLKDSGTISLKDGHRGYDISIKSSQSCDICHFPIETVSISEAGMEKVYQSTALIPLWQLKLSPGKTWQCTLNFEISGQK